MEKTEPTSGPFCSRLADPPGKRSHSQIKGKGCSVRSEGLAGMDAATSVRFPPRYCRKNEKKAPPKRGSRGRNMGKSEALYHPFFFEVESVESVDIRFCGSLDDVG